MKANPLALLLLFLMLGVAAAQQTNTSPSASNSGTITGLKAEAEKGDANAQFQIGCDYLVGQGVSLDYAEAVKWFRKAAGQGNAGAQNNLGVSYRDGQGVETNFAEAVELFRKAAKQGLAMAQANLALMYCDGKGVETNYTEGVKWYRKAAEQGDIIGQTDLGCMYRDGQGVPQDYAEAIKWFRKAADQGDADAQCHLGQMYRQGKGVPQDYVEAVKWYRRAAEQGDVAGEGSLAFCYYAGEGVPKDSVEAYKWLNLTSAHSGKNEFERKFIETGAKLRDDMDDMVKVGDITPEQIAEAQRLSAAFVPRKETPGSSSNSGSPVIADSPTATGTGFFITDDGYLISNYHVVKDATKVRLLTSAGLIDAKVVQVDAANDLALLKANAEGGLKNEETFKPLPIAASRTVNLGGTVATVGFPNIGMQGFAPKLAKGEIASLSGAGDDPRYFQISAPVQPGNSGGALVDERGNVIGIVSAKLNASAALAASGALPENVNYAVKSSLLLSFLESVPAISAKLKASVTTDRKFEDVVKSAQDAAVLVLVY